MTSQKYSDWCFTTKEEAIKEIEELQEHCKYMIIGLEEGEDGYLHYQGFLQLQHRTRLEVLKKYARTTHFEPRKGTVQQAIDYCKKEECHFEMGVPSEQGERADIHAFLADVIDEKSVKETILAHPMCMARYPRFYTLVKEVWAQPQPKCRLVWIFGDKGTGKSEYVKSRWPGYYKKASTDWWWPGYTEQQVVLVDEITAAIPYDTLLQVHDGGVNRLPTKGGSVTSQVRTFFCTSNTPPDKVYSAETREPHRWGALLRRCAFFKCERTGVHGRSRLLEVKWDPFIGWKETGNSKEFDVPIDPDEPSMAWLE